MSPKIVVVGINHAGTSTIRTILAQNKDAKVVAFDRNNNISFLGCGIALTVSGVVKNIEDLFYANSDMLQKMGADVRMHHDVTNIDTKKKEVTVTNLQTGEVFVEAYDKLVYAAGSWPIDVPIKNSDLEHVHVCKLYQHAQELIKKANREDIKSVAVIGAGYIGIELAEAYHEKGKKVTLIDMVDRVVPRYFDTEFTDRLEKDMVDAGINLLLKAKVDSYIGKGGVVTGVQTNQGSCEADLVIQCVGFKPNTALLPDVEKLPNGAIIVNEAMQSSDPDIYAIGDTCAIFNNATKQHQHIALATNAVKTGLVAASQINGATNVKMESVVGTNAICVFDNKLASTGLSEEAAKAAGMDVASSYILDNDRPEFMNDYEEVAIKLVFEKDTFRLVGAQIGSYGEGSHTECIYYLALAIQKNMTLLDLAMTDVYFLPHFNKPFNFVIAAILQGIGLDYSVEQIECSECK